MRAHIIDAMNILANVHVKVKLEWLEERLKALQGQASIAKSIKEMKKSL
ncbi:MAG: hypothetical protein NWE87_05440 [Candidatus Bathyarchaeota archaeon]|nr:hypothetical protein [Candidatus Bathyarchaeota archaeon]